MGQPVEITRLEHSASELRAFAAKGKDAAIARRLLALALVLEGYPRELAATMNGMTRQTLRDWVHRYNAEGVAGLRSDTGGGAAPLLSASELEELRAIVIEGPGHGLSYAHISGTIFLASGRILGFAGDVWKTEAEVIR